MTEKPGYRSFHLNEVARSFPETAETLLLDTYLTNEESASARVFRVYRETPPHYHVGSDEYLYVLSGRGRFWMGDASHEAEFAPETCCSSNDRWCMPCLPCCRGRSYFSRLTHRGETQKTLSS